MEEPSLFILLGLDTLYFIKLKQLLVSKSNEESNEADLRIAFSHGSNKLPEKEGKNYPLGMGLFVHDSKLHFFGGENIVYNNSFNNINFEMGKKPGDESHELFNQFINYHYSDSIRGRKWINTRMFSFTPNPNVLDSNSPTLLPIPSPILSHLGYKARPIVFTISGRVYALATKPYVGSLVEFGQENYHRTIFEVFEPKEDGKWHWRKLPDPHLRLHNSILGYPRSGAMSRIAPVLHCVIKNKLFLIADCGEYIFDAIAENWVRNPYEESGINSDIVNLASLEYKNRHLLVFLDFHLVAYDLKSYGEFEGTFGSFGSILENSILDIRNVVSLGTYSIESSSLCRVDDNLISIVFTTFFRLHVCLFEFIETPCVKVKLKSYRLFHLPCVLENDPYTLSTFLLPDPGEEIVGKPAEEENQGSTDPAEEIVGSSQDSDSTTESQENQSSTGGSNCTVFVKNLPNTITSRGVEEMFVSFKFGKIKPDGVFLNCKHHYAFVEFKDIQSLNKAIKASPIYFGKKKVYIERVDYAGPSRSSWWLKRRGNELKGIK